MIRFDEKNNQIIFTNGGYSSQGLEISDTYVVVGGGMRRMRCMLYQPVHHVEKSRIGVIIIHSDDDYSVFNIGPELAKRGYRTLCGQVTDSGAALDAKMLDIKHAVQLMKALDGVEKIVLMGHSGGATLMSAYQGAAEKGVGLYQTENRLIRCSLDEELIPADAMLILDSNWGNGSMTLFSTDPSIMEEGNGLKIDPELDPFNPKNGFSPEGCLYSQAFIKRFCAAQRERNNAIVQRALDRLHLIEAGKGNYNDDEPFIVTAAAQMAPMNKLFPQDARLFHHTKKAYPLIHKDGSITTEIVHSVRKAHGGRNPSASVRACVISTVKSYLTNRAVMAGENYRFYEDGAEGVLWDDTYNCTPGNVKNISVPMLVMGMTGGYEYLAAEAVYQNSGSRDKSIAFVEGDTHNFDCRGREEEFGDTQKLVFDYADRWLESHVL